MTKIVLIGYGAIGRMVAQGLADAAEKARLVAVLVHEERVDEARAALDAGVEVITGLDGMSETEPDLIIECAGQGAVAEHGEAALATGSDFLVISTGALAEDSVRERLLDAAARTGARMVLPAGATAGIDGLAALRVGGLDRVRYTSIKPPDAWKGTPAETEFNLDGLLQTTVIFSGSAGEAARRYPKNANLAATVALAGAGFDKTEIQLIADPAASDNRSRIEAQGPFGELRVEMRGLPMPDNPKTSAVTAHSILHAIASRDSLIVI